ncbi:MAG: T9SS type A sorting domain-containing protein [Flavobacteriaceae bacterium]|nr:T9SS type A sorting domain-containing protein [Flavobacteriaceae bacterium]
MKKYYILISLLFITYSSFSQNTLGALRNDIGSFNGYTLFSPLNSTETYLINNCGEVVHQWTSTFFPGASVYLLENGNLLRTGRIPNDDIQFGGVGGKLELFDWDNNLIWEYTHSSPTVAQHHDIFPLPNGNILMLAVTTMTNLEAIQAGRDPSIILEGKLYNEQILELEPFGTNQANIVWEWNINDHLIQDFDNTKDNFGVVKDHPELLDINFLNNEIGNANWLHINSIQYNSNLDQIILSSRLLDELYIIDHSTTTLEAASSSGGTYGKGGDFLYRWGNPQAYDMGDDSDRTLYSQHHPHWIPDGLVDAGKLLIFNNGNSIRFSAINIISPPVTSPGFYSYDMVNGFGPSAAEWTYVDPVDPENFFSAILSSAQRLPNGNTLICDGDSGYFFELDSSNNIVWEYVNPDSTNGILSQGDSPPFFNLVFRAFKFPMNYAAFAGKDLAPGDPIELNPDLSGCSLLSVDNEFDSFATMYPNPVRDYLNIESKQQISKIEIYSMLGTLVKTKLNSQRIELASLASGMYVAKVFSNNNVMTRRIIKQ